MVGKKFNRWTVLEELGVTNRRRYWLCRCDCGTVKRISSQSVISGHSQSCGCLGAERRHKAVTKHGKTGTREYRCWKIMKTRCLNKNFHKYPIYGGCGIRVCDRWINSFENFLEDMGLCPKSCASIERMDNSKGYFPGNCKWATAKEQANNMRTNLIVTFRGKTQTLKQWCEELEQNYDAMRSRIFRKGWPVERAFTEPIKSYR